MDNTEFWYDLDENKAHEGVFAYVESVERIQSPVHEANLCHAKLYSNREEPGFEGRANPYRHGFGKVTENVVQSVVDTATALIGKSRPKVTFITDNGDWEMQKLARQLERYMLGQFQYLRIYDLMPLIFRDSCVFGTGAIKLFIRDREIHVERVLIDDLVVDEAEVPTGGMPRQVHHVRLVSRAVLKSLYPDHEADIEAASEDRYFAEAREVDPDMCVVIESHYLPTRKGEKGRHTICVDTATLVDEPYTRDWLPYVFYRWSPPLTGFYGQGLAEGLMGFQIRINQLNDFIRKCQDLIAVPRVFVDSASKILKVQLDNRIGAIIPTNGGRAPTFFTPQAINAEIYNYKESLKTSAFEFAGISKMAAQATRPEGIEAAVALRELSDNQSQRFSQQQARYEEAFIEIANKILHLSRELAKGKNPPKVFMADSHVREIKWPKVDLDLNRFVMRAMPSSILGETPAGRIQKIIELTQYGVQISQERLIRLLDHPDLAAYDDLAVAQEDDIDWTIEELSEGRWRTPEPGFQDLVRGIEKITAAYLVAKRATNTPPKVLRLFRMWKVYAEKALEQAAPPQPPATMDQAAALGAVPEGNVTETGLPGVVDPRFGDTGETMIPGLVPSLGV